MFDREERAEHRVAVRKPVRLHFDEAGGDGVAMSATALNIGFGGMLCSGDVRAVSVGARTTVTIRYRDWIIPRRLVLAAVATRVSDGGSEAAFRFEIEDEATVKQFRRYLHNAFAAHQEVEAAAGPDSALAEAFRAIQINLDTQRAESSGVVLITSATAEDGKTFVSTGLASALAAAGSRVLLVDADLYRPSLQEEFALPPSGGLAELLASPEPRPLAELVLTTRSGLSVLPAGTDRIPAKLYSPASIDRLFEQLRRSDYNVVVMDSPPMLQCASAILLAKSADQVLLTVRAGTSLSEDVERTRSLLERNGVRIAGAILNDFAGLHDPYLAKYLPRVPARRSHLEPPRRTTKPAAETSEILDPAFDVGKE